MRHKGKIDIGHLYGYFPIAVRLFHVFWNSRFGLPNACVKGSLSIIIKQFNWF